MLRAALRHGDDKVAPIERYRRLAHRLVKERHPSVEFSPRSQGFIAAIEGSETLKARARALRDELAEVVRAALSEAAGRDPEDPDARLAADLLLATWSVAFLLAHRTFRHSLNTEEANAVFLSFVEKGIAGIETALAGTPYT